MSVDFPAIIVSNSVFASISSAYLAAMRTIDSKASFINKRLRSPSVFAISGSMMSLCSGKTCSIPSNSMASATSFISEIEGGFSIVYARRLLARPAMKPMRGLARVRRAFRNDRRLALRGRMFDNQVKTSAAKGIAETALLVRSQEDIGN